MNDDMTPKDAPNVDAAPRDLKSLTAAPLPSADLMMRIIEDAGVIHDLEIGRRAPPIPSELLMARIAHDAARQQIGAAQRWPRRGAWAGLIAVGVAGLAVGLADPGGAASGVWPGGGALAMNALIPAYDFQYLEGE